MANFDPRPGRGVTTSREEVNSPAASQPHPLDLLAKSCIELREARHFIMSEDVALKILDKSTYKNIAGVLAIAPKVLAEQIIPEEKVAVAVAIWCLAIGASRFRDQGIAFGLCERASVLAPRSSEIHGLLGQLISGNLDLDLTRDFPDPVARNEEIFREFKVGRNLILKHLEKEYKVTVRNTTAVPVPADKAEVCFLLDCLAHAALAEAGKNAMNRGDISRTLELDRTARDLGFRILSVYGLHSDVSKLVLPDFEAIDTHPEFEQKAREQLFSALCRIGYAAKGLRDERLTRAAYQIVVKAAGPSRWGDIARQALATQR